MSEALFSPPPGVKALARQRSEPAAAPPRSAEIPPPAFRWLTRVFVPASVSLSIAALFGGAAWNSLAPALEVRAASVVERPAEGQSRSAGTSVAQAAGWIEADPYLVYATALADGVVEEVLVLEGDRVKAGQTLARLIGDDARLALRRAQAEAASREASLAEARAMLAAAQSDWDNPVERQRAVAVARAELVEGQASLAELREQIASSEADAERLREDHRRLAALGRTAAVSESEVVTARTRMEAQESALQALRRRLEVVQARIERERAELRAAEEDERLRTRERLALDSAKASLARAQAESDRALAALDEALLRVERLEIKAPVAGVVVERFKEPGSKAMLGMDDKRSAAIASLYDPATLQVRVDVPFADAGKIAVGQGAEIVVDALPDRVFAGEVTRILHVADIQKNTLQAKIAIADPSPLLRPEMLARAKFLAPEPERGGEAAGSTAVFAPEGAVRDGEIWVASGYDGSFGEARLRSVALGRLKRDGWLEVREGLNPGDLVVLSPPGGIAEGRRLRVRLEGGAN